MKNTNGGVLLKPATLLKVTILHGCFSRFLNCANGTKSRNTSHLNVWTPQSKTNEFYWVEVGAHIKSPQQSQQFLNDLKNRILTFKEKLRKGGLFSVQKTVVV